jgi:hypothetical protein
MSQFHFFHHIFQIGWPRIEPRPATNQLSHGTAFLSRQSVKKNVFKRDRCKCVNCI